MAGMLRMLGVLRMGCVILARCVALHGRLLRRLEGVRADATEDVGVRLRNSRDTGAKASGESDGRA